MAAEPRHRGVDPYGTGGHVSHNIYDGGRLYGNVPQCFRSLLYLNANITCSFTKKLQLLGDFVPHILYRGSAPGPRWGTDPQSSFMSPQ